MRAIRFGRRSRGGIVKHGGGGSLRLMWIDPDTGNAWSTDRKPLARALIGEVAVRTITPRRVYWAESEYHGPGARWLLECFDHERDSIRTYALQSCDFYGYEQGAWEPQIAKPVAVQRLRDALDPEHTNGALAAVLLDILLEASA